MVAERSPSSTNPNRPRSLYRSLTHTVSLARSFYLFLSLSLPHTLSLSLSPSRSLSLPWVELSAWAFSTPDTLHLE